MSGEDHDILIRIEQDTKYLKDLVSKLNHRLEAQAQDIAEHDKTLNRLKGAVSASVVFSTIFGGVLLYLVFQ